MTTAVRESRRQLKGSFGRGIMEGSFGTGTPNRKDTFRRDGECGRHTVSAHARSPLTDHDLCRMCDRKPKPDCLNGSAGIDE